MLGFYVLVGIANLFIIHLLDLQNFLITGGSVFTKGDLTHDRQERG